MGNDNSFGKRTTHLNFYKYIKMGKKFI